MDRIQIKNEAKQLLLDNLKEFSLLGAILILAPNVLLVATMFNQSLIGSLLATVISLWSAISHIIFIFACLEFYRTKDVSFLDIAFIYRRYIKDSSRKIIEAFFADFWAGILTLLWSIIPFLLAIGLLVDGLEAHNLILLTLSVLSFIASYALVGYKMYCYYLTSFIAFDTDYDFKTIVRYSTIVMDGHKLKLLIQHLSFLPWVFLAQATFGLGHILLIPYIVLSDIIYYQEHIRTSLTSKEPKIKLVPA